MDTCASGAPPKLLAAPIYVDQASKRFVCDADIGSAELNQLRNKVENYLHKFVTSSDEVIFAEAANFFKEDMLQFKNHEFAALIITYVHNRAGTGAGYAEIIDFSFKYFTKPFSDGVVFKALSGLKEKNLIEKMPTSSSGKPGRQRELYKISSSGVAVLVSAVSLARHLSASRRQDCI